MEKTFRGGTDDNGFEISVDLPSRILWLRCWGLWDMTLAGESRRVMLASYPMFKGAPWYVFADVTAFMPQQESVAQVHAELMERAAELGMRRTCSLVKSSLMRLQVSRIAKQNTKVELAFFTDRAEALKWLLGS